MSMTVDEWEAKGGKVKELPVGFSGELSKGWNNSEKNISKSVEPKKGVSVNDIHAIQEWCKKRKGRAKDVCLEMGVANGFLSQIFSGIRPFYQERFNEIKKAMKVIEENELKNNA